MNLYILLQLKVFTLVCGGEGAGDKGPVTRAVLFKNIAFLERLGDQGRAKKFVRLLVLIIECALKKLSL